MPGDGVTDTRLRVLLVSRRNWVCAKVWQAVSPVEVEVVAALPPSPPLVVASSFHLILEDLECPEDASVLRAKALGGGNLGPETVFLTEQAELLAPQSGTDSPNLECLSLSLEGDAFRERLKVCLGRAEQVKVQHHWERHLGIIGRFAHDAIIVLDNAGKIAYWNEAAVRIFRYSQKEVLGVNLHELLAAPEYLSAHFAAFPRFSTTGEGAAVGKTLELLALRKGGERFSIELSLAAMQVKGLWCAVGIVRDITARRQAEERYRVLFESSRDAIVTLAPPDWIITSSNPAAGQLFNVPAGQAIEGTSFLCYVSPPSNVGELPSGWIGHQLARGMNEGCHFFSGGIQRTDRPHTPVNVQLARMNLSGYPLLQASVRDLSERHRLEMDLAHARKLEAVGQLAAGIAHEINTPSQFVGDSIYFLRDAFDGYRRLLEVYRQVGNRLKEMDPSEPLLETLQDCETEVDPAFLEANTAESFERCLDGISRITSIVCAMREFAHPRSEIQTEADINQALRTTLTIARNEYKYVAEVETDFGELPLVKCSIGDLNQVFLNLIVNAAHAIADSHRAEGQKGRIHITTSAEGSWIRVDIGDTGTGIPEAFRNRIFEPFFTTKAVGRGTGQGLAIARAIVVNKHHGTLSFETEEGKGTTFVIRLPIDGI